MGARRKDELIRELVDILANEARAHGSWLPEEALVTALRPGAPFEELWTLFRALVNVRPPWPASREFLIAQDELLCALIEERGVSTPADAEPSPLDGRMGLWRGDITSMAADAIVNAANSGMTGCWTPLHGCIDNAIHTYAGVQLRAEMARIMEAQGHEEPTAVTKVTGAYNLPAKHIIHTVGPIAAGHPTDLHRAQLAQCYRACLDAAEEHDLISIAFCCLSTGVFGFPQEEAAAIAVATTRRWLDEHPSSALLVVFDVFGETDERIYRRELGLREPAEGRGTGHVSDPDERSPHGTR